MRPHGLVLEQLLGAFLNRIRKNGFAGTKKINAIIFNLRLKKPDKADL